jgi:2-C-methyl-D-erythritol 4-phosphate cytidylyltransferase
VLESGGKQIFLFEGDPLNIKITTTDDLKLAELMIKQGL